MRSAKRRAKKPETSKPWDPDGPAHKVYVVGEDGRRRRIKARRMIVDVGEGIEIEVALFAPHPKCANALCIFSRGDLIVHAAAGNMAYVSVDRFGVIPLSRWS